MNILAETESNVKKEIEAAIIQANLATREEVPAIILEKPKEKQHGDFATNIAMQLARIAKKPPRQIAEDIIANLNQTKALIKSIEIAGPGFINFFMDHAYLGKLIPTILEAGETYGQTNEGEGTRVQVEFVSVNPTGDLHLGHARGAAFGDVLCNVLAATGYKVEREYYINDAGNQIDNLALSIEARYMEALGEKSIMPEAGYHGKDITEIGQKLVAEEGNKWMQEEKEARISYFKEYGLTYILKKIATDLDNFRVHFDNWFSERTLYKGEQIPSTLQTLRDGNYIYEEDGATWLRSTEFGDDKDRVLIKQDGGYTYLTPDITYHKNKFDRGFDKIINVWGADHHGYIPRMRAAIQALGYPKDVFAVKVIQMVNILEKGATLRMSKRSGNAVTLRDLVEEVGVDAVRYFFMSRSNDSQLDFDVELARSQSNDNPVFYVQYAHARICTMLKQAEKQGLMSELAFDSSLLVTEKEVDLLTKLGAFPQILTSAAEKYTPHHVTQYVFEVASQLHSFYNAEKVLDKAKPELTNARIALMKAVRITIANGLKIIGVSAPEKM